MHSGVVLVAAFAAAASAVADPAITPAPVMRRLDIPGLDDITSLISDVGTLVSGGLACATAFVNAADGDFPDASDNLEDAMRSARLRPDVTNNCLGTLMPSSLSAEYSTYESSFVVWYTSHRAELQSAADKCGDIPTSLGTAVIPCSTALSQYGVTGTLTFARGSQTTGTNTNTGTGSPGAAPRPTGFVAGAVAVAGVVGAAAML